MDSLEGQALTMVTIWIPGASIFPTATVCHQKKLCSTNNYLDLFKDWLTFSLGHLAVWNDSLNF
jgi:hypothetical protein